MSKDHLLFGQLSDTSTKVLRLNAIFSLCCSGQNLSTYRDQTDVFYESPSFYLLNYFPRGVDSVFPPSPTPSTTPGNPDGSHGNWKHEWPSHLVFFESLIQDRSEGKTVQLILSSNGYVEVGRGGNGWEEDSRRRGDVLVWEYNEQ